MKIVVLILLPLILFTQCSKVGDTVKPTVSISSPIHRDTIPGSESEIIMQFSAADNAGLSSLLLEIKDVNGSSLFADSKSIFGTSYTYKNSFSITKHPLKIKELTMVVHITDESNNEEVTSTSFYISPLN